MHRTVMTKTANGQIMIVRESFGNLKQRREMRKRGKEVPSDCWIARDRVIAPDFSGIPDKARPWLNGIKIITPIEREIVDIISDPIRFAFAVITLTKRGFSVREAVAYVRRVKHAEAA